MTEARRHSPSITPEDARIHVLREIRLAGRRHFLPSAAITDFKVDAWNDRGTSGGADHLHLSIHRPHAASESQLHPLRADARWNAPDHLLQTVDEMVARYARTLSREADGGRSHESAGDPNWMMSVHRATRSFLAYHGVDVHAHRHWTDLRQSIQQAGLPVMNMLTDAGRIHPLALRVSRRGHPGAYLSATMMAASPRTSVVLPYALPESVMLAAAGRSLGDVITLPGMSSDAVIHRVTYCEVTGTVIELADDDVALAPAPTGRTATWPEGSQIALAA